MSFQDWIFSFHLLFAATLVGGLVMSWIVVVALYSADAAEETLGFGRVAVVSSVAILLGLPGTIALGIFDGPLSRAVGCGGAGDVSIDRTDLRTAGLRVANDVLAGAAL